MANDIIQLPADGAGKKQQTYSNVVGANTVHAEAIVPVHTDGSPLTAAGGVNVVVASGTVTAVTDITNAITETNSATIAGDTTSIDGKITACDTGSVTISAALPAGANAIGKLAANSGVDIGDVDVTTVVPGVAATSLGKAEDAAHTTGDTGVAVLAVRSDSPASRTDVDGDYINPIADEYGRLKILTLHDQTSYDHAFFNAAADGAIVALVAGKVIKVHSIMLQAAGTVTVNIRTDDAAGTILSSWTLQAREGFTSPFAPYPAHLFQTDAGEALYCDVTAAVNVTINVTYTDDDAS